MRGGEDFGLCITVGHKVLLNRSNKCYGGGGEGVKNLPKMYYLINEKPLKILF